MTKKLANTHWEVRYTPKDYDKTDPIVRPFETEAKAHHKALGLALEDKSHRKTTYEVYEVETHEERITQYDKESALVALIPNRGVQPLRAYESEPEVYETPKATAPSTQSDLDDEIPF